MGLTLDYGANPIIRRMQPLVAGFVTYVYRVILRGCIEGSKLPKFGRFRQ